MKQTATACLIALSSLFAVYPLYADYDLDDISGFEIEAPALQAQLSPYQFAFNGDYIGDSKFRKDKIGGDRIRFATWKTELGAVAYYDESRNEGCNLSLSFTQADLRWELNPFFDKRTFNLANFSLLFFTERFSRWNWVGQATYQIDANNWGFVDFASYDGLLWGRWSYSNQLGLHVGVYAQEGLHFPLVLPVVGWDYKISDSIKMAAVFPLNFSLLYALDECWSLNLKGRWWSNRHRANNHAYLSRSVWRYRNYGLEIGANYSLNSWLEAALHGGIAFGGQIKVANFKGKESEKFPFQSAPYFGGEIVARF